MLFGITVNVLSVFQTVMTISMVRTVRPSAPSAGDRPHVSPPRASVGEAVTPDTVAKAVTSVSGSCNTVVNRQINKYLKMCFLKVSVHCD